MINYGVQSKIVVTGTFPKQTPQWLAPSGGPWIPEDVREKLEDLLGQLHLEERQNVLSQARRGVALASVGLGGWFVNKNGKRMAV